MLKREIKYEDFNGDEVTETLYFNLSTTELLEMEASYDGGLQRMLEKIIESQDIRAIIAEFKKILLAAYGQRSDNGKRFIKNDEIRAEFEQTAAFDALFMELAEDPVGAANFVAGIIPKKLQDEAAKRGTPLHPAGSFEHTTRRLGANMVDYQGNTNKDKDAKGEPEKEKPDKHVTKVVSGEVIKKPNTIGRKFKDIFFGGDAKSALRYVSADVLLPALRDLVVDVVARGTERVIYGDSPSRMGRRPSYESKVQYNRYSNPLDRRYTAPREPAARLPDQNPGWQRTSKQRIGDVVIFSREEAETVVTTMIEIIDQYDVASVADYYDLLGLETTPIDNKWGWTYLNNVQVRQVRQGYVIDLPPAEEL